MKQHWAVFFLCEDYDLFKQYRQRMVKCFLSFLERCCVEEFHLDKSEGFGETKWRRPDGSVKSFLLPETCYLRCQTFGSRSQLISTGFVVFVFLKKRPYGVLIMCSIPSLISQSYIFWYCQKFHLWTSEIFICNRFFRWIQCYVG